MNKRSHLLPILCITMNALAGSAFAVVIQWDFNTQAGSYTGTVSPGHAAGDFTGSTWNAVTQVSATTGFLDENGVAATGVVLQRGASLTSTITWGGTPSVFSEGPSSTAIYDTALMRDYFYVNTGGIVGTRVTGLDPGTYRVYVPIVETTATNRFWNVGIGLNPGTTQFGDATTLGPAGSATTWIAGTNYAFKEVVVTSTSDWIGVMVSGGAVSPQLNGLQIALVPEPSPVLMMSVGIGILLCSRRVSRSTLSKRPCA